MALNILFIGNSHTYYNHMPLMLSTLAASADRGIDLMVDQCIGEGVGLAWHWENAGTRKTIKKKPWNIVVLQDRSSGPLEEPDSFMKHALLLDGEIQKQGAKTMLFLTWANRSAPHTQATLTDVYHRTALELHAGIAPVGLAWEAVRTIDPDMALYHQDGRHASPMGSYLSACVFYAMLFNKSPAGLSGSLFFKGKMWVNLEKDRAYFLQKTAWETVSKLGQKLF